MFSYTPSEIIPLDQPIVAAAESITAEGGCQHREERIPMRITKEPWNTEGTNTGWRYRVNVTNRMRDEVPELVLLLRMLRPVDRMDLHLHVPMFNPQAAFALIDAIRGASGRVVTRGGVLPFITDTAVWLAGHEITWSPVTWAIIAQLTGFAEGSPRELIAESQNIRQDMERMLRFIASTKFITNEEMTELLNRRQPISIHGQEMQRRFSLMAVPEAPAAESLISFDVDIQSGGFDVQQAVATSMRHSSNPKERETTWGDIDKTKLPKNAFANMASADPDKKSTWKYPHHWIQNDTLYLHTGGLNAAWAAAQGARSDKKAPAEVIKHLEAHRSALGLDNY